jgi:hypothetical protein
VGVHLCGIVGQLGVQVPSLDRHSYTRLVAAILPFDSSESWALPKCSGLHL